MRVHDHGSLGIHPSGHALHERSLEGVQQIAVLIRYPTKVPRTRSLVSRLWHPAESPGQEPHLVTQSRPSPERRRPSATRLIHHLDQRRARRALVRRQLRWCAQEQSLEGRSESERIRLRPFRTELLRPDGSEPRWCRTGAGVGIRDGDGETSLLKVLAHTDPMRGRADKRDRACVRCSPG